MFNLQEEIKIGDDIVLCESCGSCSHVSCTEEYGYCGHCLNKFESKLTKKSENKTSKLSFFGNTGASLKRAAKIFFIIQFVFICNSYLFGIIGSIIITGNAYILLAALFGGGFCAAVSIYIAGILSKLLYAVGERTENSANIYNKLYEIDMKLRIIEKNSKG